MESAERSRPSQVLDDCTFSFNASIVAILILIPLLYPEALPTTAMTALLTAPLPAPTSTPSPPQQIVKPIRLVSEMDRPACADEIPKDIKQVKEKLRRHRWRAWLACPAWAARAAAFWRVMGGIGTATRVVRAAPKPTGPVRVSSGTMAGTLLSRPDPVYPRLRRLRTYRAQ